MRTISDAEFEAVSALPAAKRYAHFVKQIADAEEIWSLRNPDGWVLAGDDAGKELVPVWPRSRYAAASAVAEWADCEPAAIPLEEWISRWLPGIQRDSRLVEVFPVPERGGIAVSAEVLRSDLKSELQRYE